MSATTMPALTNAANKNAAQKALNNAAKKKALNNAAFANLAEMSTAFEEKPANANANSQKAVKGSQKAANGSQNAVKGSQNAVNAKLGGRRRTKRAKSSKRGTQKGGKISKGASKWNQFVMRTFKEMRKKNKTVKLMDAMKECSKQKKKGVKY